MTLSLQQTRLGQNAVLTNLARGVRQPNFVMRLLYPLADVADFGGQMIEFDDSAYDVVDDDRADDTPYNEIQDSFAGRIFTLNTKGLMYRVGDKKRTSLERLRINWGQRATNRLMGTAMLKHEVEGAEAAATIDSYATTNRVTLTTGSQFNEPGVDPGPVIRRGKAAISGQTGEDPNVLVLGREVFDELCENPFIKQRIQYTSRDSLTTDILAAMYGFEQVAVCNVIRKNPDNSRSRVFGKHIVMAYTNPAALGGNRLPFVPNGQIDVETPSFGYTYVYVGNPFVYNPYRDEDRGATVYKLDFDRRVLNTGVDRASGKITHGYLIANAVA
jgi:hypothetical protein